MLSREGLWRRLCGAEWWALPWALAAACLLPWLVPERWDGTLFWGWQAGGWLLLAGSFLLLRSRRWKVVPLVLLLIWSTFLGLRRQALWEQTLPSGWQELEGTISAPWRVQRERRTTVLAVQLPESLRGRELPLSLPLEGVPGPEPGTRVRFRAELRAVDPAPVFLVERPLWRARSDEAPRRVFLRSAQLMEALGPPDPSPMLRVRLFLQRRVDGLPLPEGPARDLWGALTLGIPPAQEEVFSVFAESGTIHTLVVSGLQVTLVMMVLESLCRWLLRRGGSGWAAALGGLFYCGIVGFSAPVWRGLLMGFAWVLGRNRGWKLPPVLTLHGALLLWLLTHPAAGCEPGFLLAWWALLGVFWAAEPLAGLLSPWLGRWSLPASRLAAPWLTTFPLLALLHGGAPLWGIFANLLLLPLVTLLTPLCLGLTLIPVPWLVPAAGHLLTWTAERLLPAFAQIVPLATGDLWPWLTLILGWIWLSQRHARLLRTRALTVGLVGLSLGLLLFQGTGRAPASLSLEAIDVGQGDALLLRVPGGPATVIDTGPSPWAARRITRTLSRRGVRESVHLVITHPHSDHAGGWATLARLWPFEATFVPDLAHPTWPDLAPEPPWQSSRTLLRGDGWSMGEGGCSVRWPPQPFLLDDANLSSLVLRVRWRDRELWLMGDVLALQEQDLLDLGDPEVGSWRRVVKPGHHGGRESSDPRWMAVLAPDVALITAGRWNAFGFPHEGTLRALQPASSWVTGPSFGVRAEARPNGWLITTGAGETRWVR